MVINVLTPVGTRCAEVILNSKSMEGSMQVYTVAVPVNELRELRKAFLMLRGLFDTSKVYADRLSPNDMSHQEVLVNSLVLGQIRAQKYFDAVKKLEKLT